MLFRHNRIPLLLAVTLMIALAADAQAQRYVRTKRSPWKSDPPGTYIEMRPDGSKHFYRGGVEYKAESRDGHVTSVSPPAKYEVRADGSFVRTEYHGLNSVGNKVYESHKLADMIPEKYIVRDDKGNIVQYNVRDYLQTNKNASSGNVQASVPKVIIIKDTQKSASLAFFPPAGDPSAKTGYVAIRFKGWPYYSDELSSDISGPVFNITLSVNNRIFEIPTMTEEEAKSTYWALLLPSGRHGISVSLGLNELSFSNMAAEKSGKDRLKSKYGVNKGLYNYNRIAKYEEEFQRYCFSHNIDGNWRAYIFVHGAKQYTFKIQAYAPHGTVKVVDIDLSNMLGEPQKRTFARDYLKKNLYHDPDWDDRHLFDWYAADPTPKTSRRLDRYLIEYSWNKADWSIDKTMTIPSVAAFDEWLCDNRKKLITLGEMIEPVVKGD